MNNKEAQKVLDELHKVRPEMLNDKAKRLFEAIMSIADERDKYKKIIKKATQCIYYYAIEDEDYSKIYNQEEKELLNILQGENNE